MTDPARKLLVRVVGTPILLGVVLALLYLDHWEHANVCLTTLMTVVVFASLREFYAICRRKGYLPASVVGVVAAIVVALPPVVYIGDKSLAIPFGWEIGASIVVIHVFTKLLFVREAYRVESAALTLLGVFYVGMLRFVHAINGFEDGGTLLLCVLAAAKGSDICAFCVGKAFGRRKLAPTISPAKTWEGAIAGVGGGTIASYAILAGVGVSGVVGALPLYALIIIFFSVTIASQVGDLVESAVKRWGGVKDSGAFLPEYGGMLDLVDSFFVCLPVAYFLFVAAVKVC